MFALILCTDMPNQLHTHLASIICLLFIPVACSEYVWMRRCLTIRQRSRGGGGGGLLKSKRRQHCQGRETSQRPHQTQETVTEAALLLIL